MSLVECTRLRQSNADDISGHSFPALCARHNKCNSSSKLYITKTKKYLPSSFVFSSMSMPSFLAMQLDADDITKQTTFPDSIPRHVTSGSSREACREACVYSRCHFRCHKACYGARRGGSKYANHLEAQPYFRNRRRVLMIFSELHSKQLPLCSPLPFISPIHTQTS